MTTDLGERLDASFDDGPPHRPVQERLVAGRRSLRRRRRLATVGSAAAFAALTAGTLLFVPTADGGGIDPPLPSPTTTVAPNPVHLLVAPVRFIRADTPPVLYLYGRMYRRDRDVTVLATFGEIDVARHPQGAAIVRVGDRTLWVLVVGNEPARLDEQREAPYDYRAFMSWASSELPVLSRRLARAT